MMMSLSYFTTTEDEYDVYKNKYIKVRKRGAIHRVISKEREECQRALDGFYNYLEDQGINFCKEGIGDAEYDSKINKWVGESYIFLDSKQEYDFYKDLYKKYKLLQ